MLQGNEHRVQKGEENSDMRETKWFFREKDVSYSEKEKRQPERRGEEEQKNKNKRIFLTRIKYFLTFLENM